MQAGLGTGSRVFPEGGAFRLVVTSTGDWSIRVLQLSGPTAGETLMCIQLGVSGYSPWLSVKGASMNDNVSH